MQLADSRKPPRRRGGRKPPVVEIGEVGANGRRRRVEEAEPAARQKLAIVVEITAIGGKRIGSCPALRTHHLEERLNVEGVRNLAAAHSSEGGGVSLLEGMRIVISRVFGSTM